MSPYPRLIPVRQQLVSRPVEDVPGAVRAVFRKVFPDPGNLRGKRIGITATSRGVDNIALVTRTCVDALKEAGAEPFVFPAMGSHGGATGEGQARLLDKVFGINEQTMGCPVLSTMETVELGRTPEHGIPVYIDKYQAGADGILVVARVKAHTDFQGDYESGPAKIITIGMGKKEQAEHVHAFGAWGLKHLIPEVAAAKLKLAPIMGAVALLEDGYDRTSDVVGLRPDEIMREEPKLLRKAKRQQAKLPFEELDVLVVDRMSKEISGTGMDTTVIGRRRINNEPEWKIPRVECLVVRDLDDPDSPNGIGIGLADITTKRLYDHIDVKSTQTNGLVSTFAQRLMIPVVADHDRHAVDLALYLLRRKGPEEVRFVRIRDTAHLGQLLVAEAMRAEVEANPKLEILGPAEELRFDGNDNLVPDEVTRVK